MDQVVSFLDPITFYKQAKKLPQPATFTIYPDPAPHNNLAQVA